MPPSPYFDSASKQIDESKKGLLEAVAQAGSAGKQAFDAAQQQAAQARQEAVGRAAERSALYGVGGDSQTFLGGYDARMNQTGVNRANFESGLAQTQASGESYLEKARAAIPTLQAVNINKGVEVEGKIKNTIAAAQAKAQADFEKEQLKYQRELEREMRSEQRTLDREGRAEARAAAKEQQNISGDALLGLASQAKKAATPTAPVDFGPGQRPGESIQAYLARLEGSAQGRRDTDAIAAAPLDDLAAQIGRRLGVSEAKIAELYSPSKQASLAKQTEPVKNELAKSIASKYGTRGVSYDLAKSALNGTDFNESRTWLLSGAGGMTQAEAQQKLADFYLKGIGRTGGNPGPWIAEYEILVGEYLSRLPKE